MFNKLKICHVPHCEWWDSQALWTAVLLCCVLFIFEMLDASILWYCSLSVLMLGICIIGHTVLWYNLWSVDFPFSERGIGKSWWKSSSRADILICDAWEQVCEWGSLSKQASTRDEQPKHDSVWFYWKGLLLNSFNHLYLRVLGYEISGWNNYCWFNNGLLKLFRALPSLDCGIDFVPLCRLSFGVVGDVLG